ncbi:MAG: hypothetical protein HKN68_22640 [Saprospiraceae bacterium]|nr:hypothetical protein [Saprospiraceae bacterium]
MKRVIHSKKLLYSVSIYGLLYFLLFAFPIIISGFDPNHFVAGSTEMITVFIAALIFIFGAAYSWVHQKIGGLIICFWHFIVWVFSLFIWPEAGMILVLILPMLYVGVFLIRNWYKNNKEQYQDEVLSTKLLLQILVINYAVIYLLIVFANVFPNLLGWKLNTNVDDLATWGYNSTLGISLIITFILFITGFILSWKSQFVAGILFILWYLIIAILIFMFPEFANSGPSLFSGLVILVQGILYIQLEKKPQLFIKSK